MRIYCALSLPWCWFLLAATSTAAKAGKKENEPYDVARIATAKARSTAATATIEQHNEQHYVTSIATATVCTVWKESVHFMYLLVWLGLLLHYLTQPSKIVLLRHLTCARQIYFDVGYLKRMIGIVVGIFAILVVSGLCSLCFKMDLKWYIALEKPSFVVSGGWFTVFVSMAYVSCVLAISRLVEYKHFFPSTIFFLILGIFVVFFVFAFFTLKNLWFALVCMTAVLAISYVLFIRFLTKEVKIAIEFLPAFLFNFYAFLCTLCIAMNNWKNIKM